MAKENKITVKAPEELAVTIDAARLKDREIKKLTAELEPMKETIRNHGMEALVASQDVAVKTVEFQTTNGGAMVTVPDPSLVVDQTQLGLLKTILGDQYDLITETKVTIKDKNAYEKFVIAKNGAIKIAASKVVGHKENTPKVTLK